MTDGFNSCRNVVCNFTEGKTIILITFFPRGSSSWTFCLEIHVWDKSLIQVLCTHSLKYSCRPRQLRLQGRRTNFLMSSTVLSSWKLLASLLFLVQDLARKKGIQIAASLHLISFSALFDSMSENSVSKSSTVCFIVPLIVFLSPWLIPAESIFNRILCSYVCLITIINPKYV